jgi:tetratricopeptide (TPR) repeat protein
VGREVDALLDQALQQRRFALVVGPATAGKSRSAIEAARRHLPGARLVVPGDGARALAELVGDASAGADPGPRVLWLDNLDRYLGDASGFDLELLRWLGRPYGRAVVVATIDQARRDDLCATQGEIGWAARRILERADGIQLAARLSAAERAEAERLYPEIELDRGIGEPLAAAPALAVRYRLGQVVAPVGRAMVQAAVDWRRAGMTRPLAERELRRLCRPHLEAAHLDPPAGRRGYAEGLAWACQPVASEIALLRRVGGRRSDLFAASDHLDHLADQPAGGPEPEVAAAAWDLAVATATPEEAVRVGFSAYVRGNFEAAAAAWSRAGASGHAEAAPMAALNLGVLRRRQGDTDGAVAAFEQAVASGHADAAPLASLNLRLLRSRAGNGRRAPRGAMDVFQLVAQGDVAEARRACEQVIASGHPDEAPRAAVDLGALLAMQGDIDGARVAFEYAADSRHPDHAPWAVIGIGVLLTRLGDAAYARRAYQRVVDSGHPQAALVAASNLELLGEDRVSVGDVATGRGGTT